MTAMVVLALSDGFSPHRQQVSLPHFRQGDELPVIQRGGDLAGEEASTARLQAQIRGARIRMKRSRTVGRRFEQDEGPSDNREKPKTHKM
jgi:hypothetical protein